MRGIIHLFKSNIVKMDKVTDAYESSQLFQSIKVFDFLFDRRYLSDILLKMLNSLHYF